VTRDGQALNAVRRRDRAVEDEAWLRAKLDGAAFGVLAMADGDQPLVNVNLFGFDADRRALYLHTARLGRTRETIEKNPKVCFVVADMGRLLPADEALEFSVEYESVVVFGRASVVEDGEEVRHGLQLLLDRYAPHLRPDRDYRPITSEEVRRTSVFRLDIESWSGKRKTADADFPGAFHFGEKDMDA
jgi:nitroimidazol reductase NimA-like FMN-containing flavoprotein (pyridoxamine 5'-phosphate oxidase superfamily)